MLDQMTHLLRLQVVVQDGSMRRAAQRLHITQPALTRSIAQLEKHFGDKLLTRHSRGVVATEFGQRVVSAVNRLSRQWELEESDLDKSILTNTGTLRVRAGPLWRAVVLPDVIAALQLKFPGVNVEFVSGPTNSTVKDIAEGRIDAVFGGVEQQGISESRLRRLRFTTVHDRVVARENHPIFQHRRGDETIDPAHLIDYPWIVYTSDPVYELQTIHGMLERVGKTPNICIRSESFVAVIGLLQKGDYLCILPEASVKGASLPKILPVPVEFGGRIVHSGIIFREEMSNWPPVATLIQLCEEYFGIDPADE